MKLAKSKMTPFDWEVRNFLVNNIVGSENGMVGIDICYMLGIDKASTLRKALKHIKTYTDTRIARVGRFYFIPRTFDELVDGMKESVMKTLSHMESDIMQNPSLAKYYHSMIGSYYKKANKAPQGQTVMQFNGWERDVDYYAERYKKID